jgi:hypothetical protein
MTFAFNPKFPDAHNEAKWEQIKLWRNEQLAASDWTQVADSPADKAAWAIYRQALRDLPQQNVLADKAVFPTEPGSN